MLTSCEVMSLSSQMMSIFAPTSFQIRCRQSESTSFGKTNSLRIWLVAMVRQGGYDLLLPPHVLMSSQTPILCYLPALSGTGDSQRDSRESIRANHSQLKPLFLQCVTHCASGRFARISRISDSRESPDSSESCESIRENHATKFLQDS